MNTPFQDTLNIDYIESQYARWQTDPTSVTEDWQAFFKGFSLGLDYGAPAAAADPDTALKQARVDALIHRYRDLGHLLACMDPLTACPTAHPYLDLDAFGLVAEDLNTPFYTHRFARDDRLPLKDILARLRETYCRSIGVEYMHLQDPEERRWLQERMEPTRNRGDLSPDDQRSILDELIRTALFEQFLNKKYVGVTRFSIEGADGVIPLINTLIARSTDSGVREIILGMAHRGRLNVQAHVLGRPYADILAEFEHCFDPGNVSGAGDVKYHNGFLAERTTADGSPLTLLLVNNPSHLEAVDPVAAGIARARQDMIGDADRRSVLPLVMHGDAAFAGQGLVAEVLNMSQLNGYRVGGTIHVVINNQIGYTTLPEDARSTRYATDMAKMIMAPVFHVHGEHPESLAHVARMAADYRAAFQKDVIIDVVCYRRYGHNEGDEPYFTQPLMYEQIRSRPPLYKLYAESLADSGVIDAGYVDTAAAGITETMETAYTEVHGNECPFPETGFYSIWDKFHGRTNTEPDADTGMTPKRIASLSKSLTALPDGFNRHRKLTTIMNRRHAAVTDGAGIDWANAESLAFGSLVTEGINVRLSGQDCARGTFSQRHAVWSDKDTGERYTPLNQLADNQGRFEVLNSLLAEFSVMGFEYGYALADPNALVMWEAQFGDFVNNAQTVIDLFLAAGESKWRRRNGLVLLLPHGYEGMGPEHSSARLERFLQLCAEDNIQVCYPTTPAQFFHLLRRQALRRLRKPLVVMTPKSLLRNPAAVSTLDDLAGGGFQRVIDDPTTTPAKIKKVLMCTGKIFYELADPSRAAARHDTAVVRLEQCYPFPDAEMAAVVERYPKANKWIWVQEEPENMGAWSFVRPWLAEQIGVEPVYVGRAAAASPASGFPHEHHTRQAAIIEAAIGTTGTGEAS